MNIRTYILSSFIITTVISCNPTKNIPQGEYLLKSYQIKIDNKSIGKNTLDSRIQQKPNKKIMGARFHLWLYNSSKLDKNNKWNEWLRKNGEEPVIWKQSQTKRSVEQLEIFLGKKGYYHAKVTDSIILKNKKAEIIYKIKTGWPYTVNNVTYSISDTSIARLILADTVKSLIRPGILLDEDIFSAESKRIETNLKNSGYYSFAKDFIDYAGDTTVLSRKINIFITVKPHTERTGDNRVVEAPYPLYRINSLKVNASLSEQNMSESANMKKYATDTLKSGNVSYIIPRDFPVKASTIRNAIHIHPDSLYRLYNVNRTYQRLNGLRNFKLITTEFTEISGQTSIRELDCMINLLPFTRQSFQWEVEGTISEGNPGGGGRFQYQNKSLLGHAEIFDLKMRWFMETVPDEKTLQFQFKEKMEYEMEAGINIPKFLLPFRANRFTQKYNPKTAFSISYNYQQYPEYYVRKIFNTSFGYNWRGSNTTSHIVKPLDVNFVQLPQISEKFNTTLNRYPYLKNSYQSHMVVSSSYTFLKDMRTMNTDNYFIVRTNLESAGFLLDAACRLSNQPKQPGKSYEMFGNDFSQFIKGDIDLRTYRTINGNNRIVVRTFAGIGWAYGNSKTTDINDDSGIEKTVAAMPFEKKYYAGGANSMRGWRLRSLGPGSYRDSSGLFASYPNNTGDIKLETNLEYRFKMVWLIEGALFADAGNVWDARHDSDRPGADFSLKRFYREFALNGGFGFRFDFTYLILRADVGMKMRDPAGDGRWAFTPKPDGKKRVGGDDFCFSIAIGYPFF